MTNEEKESYVEAHKARLAKSAAMTEEDRRRERERLRQQQEGPAVSRAISLNADAVQRARDQIQSHYAKTGEKLVTDDQYRTISTNATRADARLRAENQSNLADYEASYADAVHDARGTISHTAADIAGAAVESEAVGRAKGHLVESERAFNAGERAFFESGEKDLIGYGGRSVGMNAARNAALDAAKTEQDFRSRYSSAKTDEERARVKAEHAAWVKETGGGRTPREVIEDAYESDIAKAREKVRLGQMSPFEFAGYQRDLANRRDEKLDSEANYEAQADEAKKAVDAAAAEGRRARKELMGITTTAYKAFQRLRDPFMEDDERAVAKEVAGKAASRFAEKFIEENFGYQGEKDNGTDYGSVRYAIEEYDGVDPRTRLKDFGYQISFTDANGRPIIGPDGNPIVKRITESNLEACLIGRFKWEFDDEGNLVDRVGEKTEEERAEGGLPIETWEAQQETILGGERVYGGRKSRKTVELERKEDGFEREARKREDEAFVNDASGRLLSMEPGDERDKLLAELARRDSATGLKFKGFFDAEKKAAEARKREADVNEAATAAYDALVAYNESIKPYRDQEGRTTERTRAEKDEAKKKFDDAIKPLKSLDWKLYVEMQEAFDKQARGLTEDQLNEKRRRGEALAAQIVSKLDAGADMDGLEVEDGDGNKIPVTDAVAMLPGLNPAVLGVVTAAVNRSKEIEDAKRRDTNLGPRIDAMFKAKNKADLLTAYGEAAKIDRDAADKVLQNIIKINNMREPDPENPKGGWIPPQGR